MNDAIDLLASEYDRIFGNIEVTTILPPVRPIDEILGRDLYLWIQEISNEEMVKLHGHAKDIGNRSLLEVTALVIASRLEIGEICKML